MNADPCIDRERRSRDEKQLRGGVAHRRLTPTAVSDPHRRQDEQDVTARCREGPREVARRGMPAQLLHVW